jgi:hypothetical protein
MHVPATPGVHGVFSRLHRLIEPPALHAPFVHAPHWIVAPLHFEE